MFDFCVKHGLIAETQHSYPVTMPNQSASEKKPREIDPEQAAFGLRLAEARGKRWTQDQIAARYGVGKAAVSAWEKGRGDPGVVVLGKLAKFYGVSVEELVHGDMTSEAFRLGVAFSRMTPEKRKKLFQLMAVLDDSGSDAEKMPAAKPIAK